MADAYDHARSSAKKWGGTPEDYLAVHQWFDSTKTAWCDQRHRAVLHSSFGIGLAIQIFGQTIRRTSDGRAISVRLIGEQHIREDCGFVPSIEQWLSKLPMEEWMYRGARTFVRELQLQEQVVEAT
jgi:hypothetical protein